ncbi:unnamed protein product [Ostreobium quekettii]|uniref:Uncharacterized protein n=1 Tax=Ostreobium quekettii TaxID=121088 RepID=A0A8S1J6V7_9CHLO|nr:unnamed protein product [Ostreobium quekettii]
MAAQEVRWEAGHAGGLGMAEGSTDYSSACNGTLGVLQFKVAGQAQTGSGEVGGLGQIGARRGSPPLGNLQCMWAWTVGLRHGKPQPLACSVGLCATHVNGRLLMPMEMLGLPL